MKIFKHINKENGAVLVETAFILPFLFLLFFLTLNFIWIFFQRSFVLDLSLQIAREIKVNAATCSQIDLINQEIIPSLLERNTVSVLPPLNYTVSCQNNLFNYILVGQYRCILCDYMPDKSPITFAVGGQVTPQ
ncbi:MAG: hypothetical protein D6780_01725 [Candidatus Dadabacteria bacterium]|nr:MAG: hypothetical protein D6780_01725 [Candidatus Dadabacteria bacterium]